MIDRRARQLDPDDQRTLEDLAELIGDEIAVTQLAIADELTGLSDRRGMEFLGRQVLAVFARQKTPAVMVFVAVDNLKPINDEFGHEAGDVALRAVADALGSAVYDPEAPADLDDLLALADASMYEDKSGHQAAASAAVVDN